MCIAGKFCGVQFLQIDTLQKFASPIFMDAWACQYEYVDKHTYFVDLIFADLWLTAKAVKIGKFLAIQQWFCGTPNLGILPFVTILILHIEAPLTLETGSLCPRSLSPELARRGSISTPVFQSLTSPLNVPPAIRAGWVGWNDTHIKQLWKCVCMCEDGEYCICAD